jgi:radical SAM protein with 4Fe4S-binding SPASM domain
MFYKQKSNVLFRNYDSFGYLTDNRNFGYRKNSNKDNDIGDKILSESGAVFVSVLSRKPQSLEALTQKIKKQFTDVDIQTIKNDARDFYSILERDGFIVSGETLKNCDEKDTRFSYKMLNPKIKKDFSPTTHLEKSTQEFLEEHFNGTPQLTNLHIEITSRCNERCVHCYIPHEKKVFDINTDLFYDVLKQCKDLRLLHLTLSGGEPMLHKNFCDFLRKCREYDLSVNVLSNLTLLNGEIINEMKANPLLGVQVSLYSMNSEIHDEITQNKGSFKKTKTAILKLIENDIPMQISCPILKQNKESYNDVVNWAKNYGIHAGDDYVIIARYNHTSQNLSNRLSLKEIKKVIANRIDLDAEYLEQLEKEAEKKRNMTDDFVCSVCHSSICINENGNVYPCAGWQDYIVGNAKVTAIKYIWDNSEKVLYLRGLRKQDFPKCIQCPDKEYCTMCMVRNANENPLGDPLVVSEYFCKVAQLNRKITSKWKEKLRNC